MNGFEVDPIALSSVAPHYERLALEIEWARRNLVSTLEALGSYWGDDEAGRQFAANHLPGREAVLDYHDALAQGVESMGRGVSAWADGYTAAEDSLAQGL